MKLFPIVLTGSLLVNAVFTGLLAWRSLSNPATGEAAAPETKPFGFSTLFPPSETADVVTETWAELAAVEPTALAEQLRVHGYPPAVIRAMVRTRVREAFAARYRQLADQAAAVPYWQGSAYSLSANPKLEQARRALDREAAELTNQFLGATATELSDSDRRQLRRQYGDLDPAKAAELQRIAADYDDLIAGVRSEARGFMAGADAQMLAFLEQEKRADLTRLLTPEEREAVDLRTSPTAARLRQEISAFGANEDEFRALFRVQQEFENRFSGNATLTDEQARARAEAQRQLAGQISAALGPERFAEYQRTTDPAWTSTHRLVAQLGLPVTATAEIVTVQREILERVTAVRTDQALTPPQQQARIAALVQEATTRLQPALGERGLNVYKQGTGSWLRALQNAATRPVGSP